MDVYYKDEDQWLRNLLAFFIIPGKSNTIKNILKRALKKYLKDDYKVLCNSVRDSICYYNKDLPSTFNIKDKIPLFDKELAIRFFDAADRACWWPLSDWKSRYRFMKWLIKHYN